MPTFLPTSKPSESPSYTPVITSKITVAYSRESDELNATHFHEVLRGDDVELFQIFLGDDYSENESFRYLERAIDFEEFLVTDVKSEMNKFISCTPENAENTCYRVSTYVTVVHYPVTYPVDLCEVIITSKTLEFVRDRSINSVLAGGASPEKVISLISLTIYGTNPTEMNEDESGLFTDSVLAFLRKFLSWNSPSIFVEGVAFDAQILGIYSPIDYSERLLSNESSPIGENISHKLTVSITVEAEYLPPPEIDVSDIIVETFNEEEEDFIEIVEDSENAYFEGTYDIISFRAATVDVNQSIQKSQGETSNFGALGNDGGITVIVCSFLIFSIILCLCWRKHYRIESRQRKYNFLRDEALQRRRTMGSF